MAKPRSFSRWWWLLRAPAMLPLIPLMVVGNVATELFDWLDEVLS